MRTYLAPPPRLTVSEWAETKRMVSSYSAEPGPWRTARTPYLREIMDSANDPEVQVVVFQKCARIGGTEAGLNLVGYFIDQDPSPVLIVQPTVDDAKDFSKEQLAPMIADTDCLAAKVRAPNSRDSGNTVQSKVFDGGALYLVGANSPRGFRRRTARVLVLEEVDGYPASAGSEGDPIKLAIRRTATFAYRRKVYINSTPTYKGSPIEEHYLRSDQRHYHIPCPECGHMAPLEWGGPGKPVGLKWDAGHPETVRYCCGSCAALWGEEQKFPAMAAGQWVPDRPGRPMRGYHINALYSPWVSWRELVDEWIEAQGDMLKLQVFVNTALGETWEDRQGGIDAGGLLSRPGRHPTGTIPAWVQVLTMGVDVQDDRLEATVWGWAGGRRRCRIAHEVLPGDPGAKEVWADLEAVRTEQRVTEDGRRLTIFAAAVDSGAHQMAVLGYTLPRYRHRVYAVRGASKAGSPLVPRSPTRNNKLHAPVFYVGTEAAKDEWYSALRTQSPGPGFVSFDEAVDEVYMKQLTAERAVRQQTGGRWTRRYVCPDGVRNEALDCAVYALAALLISNVRLETDPPPPPPPADPVSVADPLPPPPAPERPNLGVRAALAQFQRRRPR